MNWQACVFDIDGTIVCKSEKGPSLHTLQALEALQRAGVVVIVATGRAPFAARDVLGGFRPDYLVCATGALVQDKMGKTVFAHTMTDEEMYALVDYCEDWEMPVNFVYDDGYYVYVEYERMMEKAGAGTGKFIVDGQDQTRHLQSMPYAACVYARPGQTEGFESRYGHLGLRFLPFATSGGFYDVLSPGTDKAVSVGMVLERLAISWKQTVVFGDGLNDASMLEAAGLGVVMENGEEELKVEGRLVAPSCADDGAAQVIENYIL